MKTEVFITLRKAGVIAKREVVDYICAKNDPVSYLQDILSALPKGCKTLTMPLLTEIECRISSPTPVQTQGSIIDVEVTGQVNTSDTISKDDDWDDMDIMRDCTKELHTIPTTDGFVAYFRHRFETLKRIIIENNRDLMNRNTDIGVVKHRAIENADCYVIGMVSEIRHPKDKKSKVIILEDYEDAIVVVIPEGKLELLELPIVEDIVIGVKGVLKKRKGFGVGTDPMIIANTIYLPEIPKSNIRRVITEVKKNKGKSGPKVAFLGDTHIGSKKFLDNIWHSFVEKVNGRGLYSAKEEDLFRTLRYIIIVGDIVDGIGIYANQKDELSILDIFDQYEAFGKMLEELPSHIRIVVIPGNHDAVRPAEPQPAFNKDINALLPNNVICLSNPAWLRLNGSKVLVYHGRGIDDFVSAKINLNYNEVLKVMKTMLRLRHLAPIYGDKTPLAPEPKDHLIIDMVPDVFVTGHVHKFGCDNYNGVVLINASTWQAQTKYQKDMNFNPDPGKIAFYDIKSRQIYTYSLFAS